VIYLISQQDEIGVTTYQVFIEHLDHSVLIHEGQDRERAEEIQYVISYELRRAAGDIAIS
jgi:hypothetical protein